jgi:hypothetical protein
VEGLGPARHPALLPRRIASIDALVQAVYVHYTAHQCVFVHPWHCKKEMAKRAAD